MKTFSTLSRHLAMFWALWAALAIHIAQANDVDEQGRLIAGPMETDLVERGYLFYPLRVLPKHQNTQPAAAHLVQTADNINDPAAVQSAPVSQIAPTPAAPLPTPPLPAMPVPQSAGTVTAPAPVAAAALPKPTAASVLIQRMEPIKSAPLTAAKNTVDDSHSDAGHDAVEPAKPVMSKAELAKAERAKAAQERAEKRKQEQAKVALAREEKRKEQKAKAEQLKAERAKAAQERAEKLKQEQAKAELIRAERVRAAALAKVDRALEELARADKMKEALVKAEATKAEAVTMEANKTDTAQADAPHSEAAQADASSTKAVKADDAMDESVKVEAAPQTFEQEKHSTLTKEEPVKTDAGQKNLHHADSHTTATPVALTAGQKILVINRAKGQPAAADH